MYTGQDGTAQLRGAGRAHCSGGSGATWVVAREHPRGGRFSALLRQELDASAALVLHTAHTFVGHVPPVTSDQSGERALPMTSSRSSVPFSLCHCFCLGPLPSTWIDFCHSGGTSGIHPAAWPTFPDPWPQAGHTAYPAFSSPYPRLCLAPSCPTDLSMVSPTL